VSDDVVELRFTGETAPALGVGTPLPVRYIDPWTPHIYIQGRPGTVLPLPPVRYIDPWIVIGTQGSTAGIEGVSNGRPPCKLYTTRVVMAQVMYHTGGKGIFIHSVCIYV
jgi:hypothetical protein